MRVSESWLIAHQARQSKAIFEYWALTSNGVMTNHVYK